MLSVYGRSAQEGAMRFLRRERIVAPRASIMSQPQTRCPPTPISIHTLMVVRSSRYDAQA